MDVRCAVRAVSKQHDRLLIYVVPENRWELRRLSTLELVTEIPGGMPMLHIHFDEHYGVFYATGYGPCLEFDAATGTLLRTLPGTYGPVRRLRGTDTLFCAGVQADVNNKATFKLVDMTNGKVLWKTKERLSNGWPLSVAGELKMTRSADGRTIYVYGMYGGLPSAPSVRYVPIVSFSLDRGLERFMMGRPLHLENDRDKREGGYLVGYYDAASETVILDDDKVLRHGGGYPLAPTALRVPIEAPQPLPMVHCDGQRLRVIAEGWHLDQLYDIDGRSVPLPCPGTPCRDVHVAHLAAGTYLCRLRNGDDHHTATISIRR
jgi:hypothetical protein